MTDREAMKMALEAMKISAPVFSPHIFTRAFKALEAALAQPEQSKYSDIVSDGGLDPRNKFDAQPEQEPVAYLCENATGHKYFRWKKPTSHYKPIALYTAPLPKRWAGLTDEERRHYNNRLSGSGVAEDIEAKLKEKNT